MKVWVVGARGMVGSKLLRELRERGIEAVAPEVDVTDRDLVAPPGCTHVVNCAAYTKVDLAEREEARAFAVNCDGVAHLARAAEGARLVHLSTDYVFDGMLTRPYREDDPVAPLNVYGRSKAAGEMWVKQGCVIRTSALFGPGGNHFVGAMVRKMRAGERVRVVADQRTRPTFTGDLVDAVIRLLDAQGTYHVAGGRAVSWYEFAREIAEELDVRAEIVPISSAEYGALARRPLNAVLDTEKAGPLRDHREALQEFLWNDRSQVYS